MADKKRPLLRHVLMLSLSLNVGLILRLLYVDESWDAERGIHAFCMEDKLQKTGEAPNLKISSQVSQKMMSVSSSMSPSYELASKSKRGIELSIWITIARTVGHFAKSAEVIYEVC